MINYALLPAKIFRERQRTVALVNNRHPEERGIFFIAQKIPPVSG